LNQKREVLARTAQFEVCVATVRDRQSVNRAKRYVKGAMVFVWCRGGSLNWGCVATVVTVVSRVVAIQARCMCFA
jgi:hypothetical protein